MHPILKAAVQAAHAKHAASIEKAFWRPSKSPPSRAAGGGFGALSDSKLRRFGQQNMKYLNRWLKIAMREEAKRSKQTRGRR